MKDFQNLSYYFSNDNTRNEQEIDANLWKIWQKESRKKFGESLVNSINFNEYHFHE
jgi:hypothetical protein